MNINFMKCVLDVLVNRDLITGISQVLMYTSTLPLYIVHVNSNNSLITMTHSADLY